ncbi:hypothetical protein C8Q80DRAFT_1119326 [Daedaleopsis nitida]|nr:hypothetical protein C8Q80DRAFT_1119326 [Daedaleopsis nitida]
MDYDESSDILGGRLQVSPQTSSAWSDPGQITLLLGLGLAATYAWVRLAPHYRQWRETRYRKAMRRRHGIPDDDNRPFNVAYAAALQARKGGERRATGLLQEPLSNPLHDDANDSVAESAYLSHDKGASTGYGNLYPSLDGRELRNDLGSRSDAPLHSSPLYDRPPQFSANVSSERSARPNGVKQPMVTRSLHGKHALDEEVDETQAKKTRVEGEDLIDGDEEAGWHGSGEEMDVDEVQPAQRGSKRVASIEGEEGLALSRSDRLDKRARKVSIEMTPLSTDEDMEEDDVIDNAARGKKRDRAEAGSTFGGDDSFIDEEEKPQRRRMRRTVSNKFGQSSSRGQKRGRDLHSHDSDDSDSDLPKRTSTRKKRGRRSQDEVVPLSNDPLCKGRHIGEEWESNGVRYKVGPNGQRLRQELVKKSRSLFPMTWLSEEEYNAAKERHELAWQDTPVSEPQTPGDVPDSPSKAGKSLLWSSTISSRESPMKRGPLRQSVATNVGMRLNVFPPPQVATNRRIASVYQAPASPATESPKLQKSKSYSKWEKQDLEAAAMSKIRDRQLAARAAEASKPSPAAPSGPTSASTPSSSGPSSTPAAAPSASAKPPAPTAPSFSFAPGAAAPAKPAAAEGPKPNAAPTAPASAVPPPASKAPFSFPGPTPSAAPPASAPQPNAAQGSTSVPNFFSKPSTATPTPSVGASSFFAPKPAQTAPSTTPTTGGAAPPQSNSASKPEAPKPSFFAPSSAQQTGTSAPTTSTPLGTTTNDASKSEQTKSAPGVSLLSRLGMGHPQSSSAPTFSFAKPDAPAASTPATSASEPLKTSSNAPPSSGLKFSFGVSSKPTGATPTPNPTAPAAATTSTPTFGTGNNGSSQPAMSTPNVFGGNSNKDAAGSTQNPTFSFATPSAPPSSAFGGPSATTSSTTPAPATPSLFSGVSNGASKPAEAPKTAFGTTTNMSASAFGGGATASSLFGNAAAPKTPFGTAPSAATPSAFGGSASGAAASSEPSKPAFGFTGNNSSSSTSTPSFFGNSQPSAAKTDGQAPKPMFSFNTSSSTPAFGSTTPSTPSGFGTSTPSGTPAFGATSTPTFGATTTPAAPAAGSKPSFSFGSSAFGGSGTPAATPAASSNDSKPAAPFNFGAKQSSNNGSAPSPSSFGFGSQPQPSAGATNGAAGSSPFGAAAASQAFSFGAAATPFSFGSNAGQNAQNKPARKMLSTPTPRPLPPAKARKSTSLNFGRFAPPPPYAPLDETILDSPISITSQLMRSATKTEGIGMPGTPGLDDWMNEKSREELSDLLLKADGIIKSRETELTLTSTICKSLYSDNVTLKTKHEALLARLPGTRASTPTVSRPTSPLHLEPPALEQSPSYSAIAFPASPGEPAPPLVVSRLSRRTRRISVTPGELALLSDQNAELIDKLESLEAESLKADQAGKRKLRRLEQEIQSLRDELDTTQARGAELEEQAKKAAHAAAAQKRKEEREARLQALKEKSTSVSGSDVSEEIRDFAPPSSLPASRSSPIKRTVSSSSTSVDTSTSYSGSFERLRFDNYEGDTIHVDEPPQSYFPALTESGHDTSASAEYAIISQLLSKIRELEETNAQIKEQQKATEERMRAAQWDAESIRRVYDCLDDGDVDLAIQEEDEQLPGMKLTPSNDTIRFSSLRRTIVGDMSRLMASDLDVFAQGIRTEMQSTIRDGITKANVSGKARKTVVGLFDTDTDPDTSIESAVSRWGEYPPTLRVSPAFRQPDPADISIWSSGRTLGSELGSEYGDDWAERGINHHLRASSLVDLAGLYSSPATPSESISVLPSLAFPSVEEHPAAGERWDAGANAGPSTPPRIPNLQLQPPTPSPDNARSPASVRQYRLSQTVRARTNRWVEHRFHQSPPEAPSSGKTPAQAQALHKRPSASTLGRRSAATDLFRKASGGVLADTFDSAVGQIRRVASRGSFGPLAFAAPPPPEPSSRTEDDEPVRPRSRGPAALGEDDSGEGDRSISLRRDTSVLADGAGAKQDGIVGFVLEAWLWLQFIIVVAVFLWSTAKRGPKVVLEAERRSAGRGAGRSS